MTEYQVVVKIPGERDFVAARSKNPENIMTLYREYETGLGESSYYSIALMAKVNENLTEIDPGDLEKALNIQ